MNAHYITCVVVNKRRWHFTPRLCRCLDDYIEHLATWRLSDREIRQIVGIFLKNLRGFIRRTIEFLPNATDSYLEMVGLEAAENLKFKPVLVARFDHSTAA